MKKIANLQTLVGLLVASLWSAGAAAQMEDAPYECDDRFAQCGTPEQSGGGGGGGGGGSILINNTDVGVTYQFADDYDDDGVEDPYDVCPFDSNRDQLDGDGDGVGDVCDNCPDVDNADQADLDGDGMGDVCDADQDEDGVANDADNCPINPNPDQTNTDGLEGGDACDADMDGDGVPNLEDDCPKVADVTAEEGGIDLCSPDDDGDQIRNIHDNCPQVANYEQEDADGDGKGDKCDSDNDDDGVTNGDDNCPMVANVDQVDADRDGVGDACDDKYCLVVYGDADNCLDPSLAFAVHTPSFTKVAPGSDVPITLFANRENAEINYTISIEKAPNGSSASVAKPVGAVNSSRSYMYQYTEETVPVVTPDEPGTYLVKLHAQMIGTDPVTGVENPSAETYAEIVAEGDALKDGSAGGCSVAATGSRSTGIGSILVFGLLLLGLAVRRWRR